MEQRIKQNEDDIKQAMNLFTEHLKVYAENGKELTELKGEINGLRSDIKRVERALDHNYVTQDQFRPVRSLAYGAVALILTAVVVAGLTLVITQKSSSANEEVVIKAVTEVLDQYNIR